MVTSFSGQKSQQNRTSQVFFLTITIPLAHGDSEGCIIPNASKSRNSWLAGSALSDTFYVHIHGWVQPLALLPLCAWQFYTYRCRLCISRENHQIQLIA